MATVFDLIDPRMIAQTYDENVLERKPYLGEGLFPERKQRGTEISYLLSKAPHVRLLSASGYDADTITIGRDGVETKRTEMPFFKNSMQVNEKQAIELQNALEGGNQQLINVLFNEVYNDQKKLLDAAALRREQLRMMLLTTGKIAISTPDNGQLWEYDFGVPTANKVKPAAVWSDKTTADPIADILAWQDAVEEKTGERPNRILMNRKTLNLFASIDSVKTKFAFYALTSAATNLTTAQAQRIVEQETNSVIYVYDKGYYDATTSKFVKFVPDNTVVLFTEGAVGEGVFGTTPEEVMLAGSQVATVGISDLGVAVTKYQKPDSVMTFTKASMVYLPVLNNANTLVIADVSQANG